MYEELEKKAKKKVEAKMDFYILAFIFAAISVLLLVISYYIGGPAGFWIRLPIIVFGLILAVMYPAIFGLPSGLLSEDWKEDEIEKEMARLYRERGGAIDTESELSEEDRLELKELERLKKKWDWGEDYV